MGHVIIYVPTKTISGIGAEGIEEAKNQALKEHLDLQILVIKAPKIIIHSSNVHHERLNAMSHELPIKLPDNIWLHRNYKKT